jgi:aminoglycoside 3-N-acetyltransferase
MSLVEALMAQDIRHQDVKVLPEELTEGFRKLGLRDGDSVMMHASLESFGIVEGGAAMLLHRLLGPIGKKGTLMMPAFTSVTTHGNSHDNYTKPGCWCEGKEERHIPFIPELQPDKNIGVVAHRLCSWPASRRSRHPRYSFVAVGNRSRELIHEHPLMDPLLPIKKMLAYHPFVLMAGVGFEPVISIQIAQEQRTPLKFSKARALTVNSRGQDWVEILEMGCSNGFDKIKPHLSRKYVKETSIGLANIQLYPMEKIVDCAKSLLEEDPMALACDNSACLSCALAPP